MENKKLNNKIPTFSVMHVAFLLLCAVLLSAYAIGGLYARYTTSQNNSDEARVAKFVFNDNNFTESQSTLVPVSIAPGESQPTSITVQNNGEVAIKCVVKIENLTENLPLKPMDKIDGKTDYKILESEVIPCDETRTFTWNISWPAEENSIDYIGKMDILRVTVTVEQVD